MKRRRLVWAVGALLASFGLGLLLRPSLDSLLLGPDLSIHESRRNLRDWKYGRLQVLVTQWKLTGESDRTSGLDELVWLWRMVLLNTSFLDECVVRMTRFTLQDGQGFDVAVGEAAPQKTAVRGGETASVSGSGRLARVRMSPKLQPKWDLETTCLEGLPRFGEAKITGILETVPGDRRLFVPPDLSDDSDSRTLGSVAKARALHWSVAGYIREARDRECLSDRECLRRKETFPALFDSPRAIQIQFPRGARLKVGDMIYLFDQRRVEDEAGVRSAGYGFTADGASLPLRHWHDETRAPRK